MIKAVIFDMDGVITDNSSQDFLAWKRIFSDFSLKLNHDTYLLFLGKKGEEIIRNYISPNINKKEAVRIVDKKEKYFVKEVEIDKLKPAKGLKKLFKKLKKNNIKIGLGTSAPKYKVNIILNKLGFQKVFSAVVVAEEVKKGKPNPEIYLKVARKLNLQPKECIVVEDAPNGVCAAKNAGMKCIAITTTHKERELKRADKIIRSFRELTVKELNRF
jgi:beta-phosphoglucomutase family hydrolase